MPPDPAPVVRFLAAVVVVVDFLWRTVPPLADRGAEVALLGERLPEPTEVELGEAGCNNDKNNIKNNLLFQDTCLGIYIYDTITHHVVVYKLHRMSLACKISAHNSSTSSILSKIPT